MRASGIRSRVLSVSLFMLLAALSPMAMAQKQEVALSLGGVLSGERNSSAGTLDLGRGTALQANYAYRVWQGDRVAVYIDTHFLASPLREVNSAIPTATRDFATIYLTPGVKLKFNPGGAVQPYVVAGGGWALYEQSTLRNDGEPNDAPRTLNRGVLTYGGGVDLKTFGWLSLRGEFRNFYSGSPAYNVGGVSGGQNNPVLSGGLVFRFGS